MITYQKITNKKDGKTTWQAVITYEDSLGVKRTLKKSGFQTKKEARQWAEEKFRSLDETLESDKNMTVQDAWEGYSEVELCTRRPGTIRNYTYLYNNYVGPALGLYKVRQLNFQILQNFFNQNKNMSRSTIGNIRIILNKIIGFAIKHQVISENPMTNVRSFHAEFKKKSYFVDYEEFDFLIEFLEELHTFEGLAMCMACRLGYFLGLRMGEALGLSWSDIDFKQNTVTIRNQLVYTYGQKGDISYELTPDLKTPQSYATLPLPIPLRKELINWRRKNPNELVCCWEDGSAMNHAYLSKYLREYGTNFHSLRHTFITNVVMSTDPKTAAVLSRHSDVKTTLNIYTEVTENHSKDIVNRVFKKKKKE